MKLDELQFRLEEASALIRGGLHNPSSRCALKGGGSAAGTGVGLALQVVGEWNRGRIEAEGGEACVAGAGGAPGGGLGGGGGRPGVAGGEQGAGEGEVQNVWQARR